MAGANSGVTARAKLSIEAVVDFLTDTRQEVLDRLDQTRRAIESLHDDPHAILKRFQASGDTDANGDVEIKINDGPNAGHVWDVKRLGIIGQTEAAISGAAWVYRNSVHPLNFLDYTLTLPAVGPWGTRQLSLFGTERLVIHIDGGPASSRIFVNGQAWQRSLAGLDIPGD